ncbi:hypothetical protein AVEN_206022-1 [Araneus ventricosus]|uniref:Uncharacterized protein n=1 Tax=Araneus ventricosus TaxID=182803 RepID=A0A4Y2GZF5_ARAVE|nr:hypothetical protein AVEN_206022-1 [Araneus ventricosus]
MWAWRRLNLNSWAKRPHLGAVRKFEEGMQALVPSSSFDHCHEEQRFGFLQGFPCDGTLCQEHYKYSAVGFEGDVFGVRTPSRNHLEFRLQCELESWDSFQPRCSANTGSKRPSRLSSDCGSSNQHNGDGSPRVYISSPLSSLFPPFLNTLPSEARGMVDELSLGESSSSLTNHPTAAVCLPPWC